GDRSDSQSRYIEAAVHGVVVGALYLPNGNPQPGPKLDYKLKWMARLARHASTLVDLPHPVALLGDLNVIPTDEYEYDPKSGQGAPAAPRCHRGRPAACGGAAARLQRDPRRRGRGRPEAVAARRADPARGARRPRDAGGAGLARRAAPGTRRRAHLHFAGLLP